MTPLVFKFQIFRSLTWNNIIFLNQAIFVHLLHVQEVHHCLDRVLEIPCPYFLFPLLPMQNMPCLGNNRVENQLTLRFLLPRDCLWLLQGFSYFQKIFSLSTSSEFSWFFHIKPKTAIPRVYKKVRRINSTDFFCSSERLARQAAVDGAERIADFGSE